MNRAVSALAALTAAACHAPPGNAPPDGPIVDAGPGSGSDAAPPSADPFAALQALPATCSSDRWCWRRPRPAGNDYSRVFATAPDNVWLIGQHGTVLQWNGRAWTTHRPPVPPELTPAQYPYSISGRGPADMWLVFGSTVQHWDGAAWAILDSLPPSGTVSFNSIWAAPGGDVWVTMSSGSLKRSRGGAFETIGTGCTGCFLGSIWGTAADDFFITILPAGILHYDGHGFTRSYGGPQIAGSYLGTRNDVWASGDDGALLHWDGAAWTANPTGLAGWYITGVAALASNDVWWWANRSSAMSAFLHWDGKAVTTTRVDTTAIGAFLYAGAIIDGRWWLVGGAGAVYTKEGDGVRAVIDPHVTGLQAMWGAADDDMYFATGGEIEHWDGKTTQVIPIAAGKISGLRTERGDELFATGFDLTADRTQYIATAYHFDGTAWSKTPLVKSSIDEHRYFTQVFAMAPGEAMAVGYGGIAYRYRQGTWSPVATGTTADLAGVWGPDADHVWITGARGTLLTWQRDNPDVAVADATLPPLANDLGAIHGAGGTTWIAAGGGQVLRNAGAGWDLMQTGVSVDGIFAIDAGNVVVGSTGNSGVARWNGAQFVREDNACGTPTPLLFQPPGGPMLAGWLWGVVQHP